MTKCYLCGSGDTMRPFKKPEQIAIISWFLPLRWRFCRSCYRHFITTKRAKSVATH
jgi:hypothetical protein